MRQQQDQLSLGLPAPDVAGAPRRREPFRLFPPPRPAEAPRDLRAPRRDLRGSSVRRGGVEPRRAREEGTQRLEEEV
eukprot:g24640.t1